MITSFDDAVKEFFFYKQGTSGSFHTALFDLIAKADPINKAKLERGFPFEVEAVLVWNHAGNNGDDLFKDYGLISGPALNDHT